ncbi:TPA: hypothetical protein DDZ86_01840 [Candidatus Dependentiae bacterium]|nr:hypothetical protein [Candidatus Dependentiae bacterium]
MNLLDKLIKVSETFELPDKIKTKITSDLLKSRATLKILHKTCSTFESSLGLFIEKARPLFELYKKLLTSLVPSPNGENLQALGVLDALLLCSSTTVSELKTITQSLNSLQNLLTIIKETRFLQKYQNAYCLQKDGDPFLNPNAPSKELRNKTLGDLLQTPGFMFLFWGTFIDNGLEKKIDCGQIHDSCMEKDTIENIKLFKKINSVYLLHPLLEKTIEQLKSTQNNLLENQNKKAKELEQKKNLKNQKKLWKKQNEKALTKLFSEEPKCQKKEIAKEIAPVEEEFSTTDTPTTTTNTPCNKTAKTLNKAKKEKCEKVLAPLNAHNSPQQAIDEVNNFFEQTKTPTFFKLNDIILTESHLTSSAGDFLKGVVIAYKKPENPLDLKPENIDFSALSTHEIFHKTAVESLRKNPDLLKKCEKIERDYLGECEEKSLKNTIGLWLQNDTTLIALLPCLIRTSSDKSKNLFKEISEKIKEGSLLDDRLALGLHKGTIALLLTHSKTKSDKLKYKAQHLFFHEDTETKQFHINKK